ncbi:hypothetical protein FACS1894182_10110 [Bacteroidia bacterium]|nr:hypothetical protein FACS1894182_10110 [Bacteroidia bacterium]
MLKEESKIILKLIFLMALSSCCKESKVVTKDVLFSMPLDSMTETSEHRVDSIVLEYTDIDSQTQLVKRTFYSDILDTPHSTNYKLINCTTKAYIELTYDTLKSIYLDTETLEYAIRSFREPTINLTGKLKYKRNVTDSVNNINYYVFQGNDIDFSWDTDDYFCFYFDSIFHLKKIYNDAGTLIFSVK